MKQSTILVVEDDAAVRRGLVDALEFAGYRVESCVDGTAARELLTTGTWDLVLLDVMLPGVDGFTLLEELRRVRKELPVIMVTARGTESDRVNGLTGGADDYVVKPFSARELIARVEAVLRRSPDRPVSATSLACPGRTIHLSRREVQFGDGSTRPLSEKEVAILSCLADCSGRPVTRDELLKEVWGLDPRGLETRTVDMHIARLRDKLSESSEDSAIIMTVRSKGYMLAQSVVLEHG